MTQANADGTDFEPVFISMLQRMKQTTSTTSETSAATPEWSIEAALKHHHIEAPNSDSLSDFYSLASQLKKVKRAGWLRYGIK